HQVPVGNRFQVRHGVRRRGQECSLHIQRGSAGLQQGFSQREKSLLKKLLAGDHHFFLPLEAVFFPFFTSPCTWQEVQLSRSGWLVGGAFFRPSRWQLLQASPSWSGLTACGICGGLPCDFSASAARSGSG